MQHWARGQQLHEGKYLIEEILGGGGFGVTYRAQNCKEGKLVAIKTLNAIQQGKADFVKRQGKFMNEALCLAKCSHPHVVEVYEVFPEGDLWCMVMELIDGIDLADYLEDNGILSEEKALPMIQQVGNALSFIHKQGFTHQDVKPQNIMLRQRGFEAVLIDFGLARQATIPGKLRTNSNSGTECFAPLELLEKRAAIGAYTDVYSLAATLYVMLTGELPFPSQFRKQNIPLIPPKQHNNKISDRVNAAIMKGMELEPQNRPQSVQEWLDLVMPKKAANLVIPKELANLVILKQAANDVQLVIPKQAANQVQLVSAVGMDYINLRNLLAAGRWKDADQETARVMLKVAGREEEGWLDTESIDKFPCDDLRTIDQLWVKYSNGHFGFSVQKRIYQSLGGTSEYNGEIWERFGDRVGWSVNSKWLDYDDLKFNTKAPEGHLPAMCEVVGLELSPVRWQVTGVCWWYLFSRLETCRLHLRADIDEVQLISAVGMDYRNLRNLLAAGKWKEADEETKKVMLKVAGREEEKWLDSSSINNFPCEDLRTIDQLWVKYSNGRFGFSVQKRIYQSLGGTREYNEKIGEAFGDRVGWRVKNITVNYDYLTFNTKTAPEGHLPSGWVFGRVVWIGGFRFISSLASRLVKCNI